MTINFRRLSLWAIAAGIVLILGSQSPASAKKGVKISIDDDPSIKEGSPSLVLVEVSDFHRVGRRTRSSKKN